MAIEVILPRVDMDMTAAIIRKWYAAEGDTVNKGALLFEIETDKAAMEIEAPASGILRHVAVGEGQSAPVGKAVAYIYGSEEAATPAPARPMKVSATVPKVATVIAAPATGEAGTGIRATPLARRLARQASIALAGIEGSGPRGRIVAEDVRRVAEAGALAALPAPSEAIIALYAPDSYTSVPADTMRRTIAQRLTRSKQTIPHFYLSATCTIDLLLEARASLNAASSTGADGTPAWRLSINDFVIKALALALQRVPRANVTWADDAILHHHASDVGVAVAVEGGLFTPVIRGAEAKTLSAISCEMKDLAARARALKLQPAEYRGGTTAISNLGMYGIEDFTAIINPPHATILAVGAGIERFVPVKGHPVLKTQMTCTLSCDHRAVDGATGAELLQAVRNFLEDPMQMLA
jgi:pyruvate dehydrogenase E2 component (dihydrolipoamide acetyltransferase)